MLTNNLTADRAAVLAWAREVRDGHQPESPLPIPSWAATGNVISTPEETYGFPWSDGREAVTIAGEVTLTFQSAPIRSGDWETHVEQTVLVEDDGTIHVFRPILQIPDEDVIRRADGVQLAAFALMLKDGAQVLDFAERHPVAIVGVE